jgi:hypothetical protein
MASPAYARATLFHLLGVTFLPFSMLAVSRYDLAAAVRIYGANMIWLAVTALLISRFTERDSGRAGAPDGRVKLGVLIASAVLSMIASLYSPDYAMLLYLLVIASPLVKRAVYREYWCRDSTLRGATIASFSTPPRNPIERRMETPPWNARDVRCIARRSARRQDETAQVSTQ